VKTRRPRIANVHRRDVETVLPLELGHDLLILAAKDIGLVLPAENIKVSVLADLADRHQWASDVSDLKRGAQFATTTVTCRDNHLDICLAFVPNPVATGAGVVLSSFTTRTLTNSVARELFPASDVFGGSTVEDNLDLIGHRFRFDRSQWLIVVEEE
jgi:hypothetical protein